MPSRAEWLEHIDARIARLISDSLRAERQQMIRDSFPLDVVEQYIEGKRAVLASDQSRVLREAWTFLTENDIGTDEREFGPN